MRARYTRAPSSPRFIPRGSRNPETGRLRARAANPEEPSGLGQSREPSRNAGGRASRPSRAPRWPSLGAAALGNRPRGVERPADGSLAAFKVKLGSPRAPARSRERRTYGFLATHASTRASPSLMPSRVALACRLHRYTVLRSPFDPPSILRHPDAMLALREPGD
jgi:hypothetical protein